MAFGKYRGAVLALAAVPLLLACGGNADRPPAPDLPPCSGAACGAPPQQPAQQPVQQPNVVALCPASADIANDTYLGGTHSGEVVSLNIDAIAMTYRLTWLESSIPLRTGAVSPTRAGTMISGQVIHPPSGTLPSDEQTRCTFILGAGSGTALGDGLPYTTPDFVNNPNPPMIFVGQGVASGGIPGATVQFGGVLGLGVVDTRHFDFYPFFGFAHTTTDATQLTGTYNGLLYHTSPTALYATVATTTVGETFDASGNCTSVSSGGCLSVGNALTVNSNGYFDSTTPPQIISGSSPGLLRTGNFATSHMILGQVNGALVPLVVRTGSINTGTLAVDDEEGIAILASTLPLVSGAFDGSYVGADSNFESITTVIRGVTGTFDNPSSLSVESGFGLSYGPPTPGLASVLDGGGNAGFALASGGVYAIEIQGPQNGGVAPTSANSTTSNTPYFGIGAMLSK
jgi:hypothetical protein